MKYRDPETGEFKELYAKTADTLPVGTVVDYEGTEVPAGWEEVEKLNYIVAIPREQTVLTGNTDIFLNKWRATGSKLTVVNNKVKIGAGVKKVRISASIFMDITTPAAGYFWGRIAKNNQNTAGSIISLTPDMGFASSAIAATIIEVAEGDTLWLNVDVTGAVGKVRDVFTTTWLCVEVVE